MCKLFSRKGELEMADLTQYKNLLTEKKAFLHLAFVRSNGSPHISPIWFNLPIDGLASGIITINTAKGRVKAHLKNGQKISASIMDPDNPYKYLGIEGSIVRKMDGEEAEKHIDQLAKKYLNQETYPYRKKSEQRIKYEIKVEKIITR
jgi:PPOX class probable F420-dependent enzyme